jgi:hypothetical protein
MQYHTSQNEKNGREREHGKRINWKKKFFEISPLKGNQRLLMLLLITICTLKNSNKLTDVCEITCVPKCK